MKKFDFSGVPETPSTIETADPKQLLKFFKEQRDGLMHSYHQMRRFGGPLTPTEREYLRQIRSYDDAIDHIKKWLKSF